MQIIYFTGTGNSKYEAERIAGITEGELLDARKEIKEWRPAAPKDEDVVIVTPVYAWRTPHVLEDWMRRGNFSKVRRLWYVMTCGDQIGGADKLNKKLSEDLGCIHMGTAEIIMPENYIAMFNAPFEEEAKEIIDKAEIPIDNAACQIRDGLPVEPAPQEFKFLMSTRIVNPVFYGLFIKDRKFFAKNTCMGCGKCASLCPLNNIVMKDGHPVWMGDCTHCMACICYCPEEAIEYGKDSENRFRYNFERLDYSSKY